MFRHDSLPTAEESNEELCATSTIRAIPRPIPPRTRRHRPHKDLATRGATARCCLKHSAQVHATQSQFSSGLVWPKSRERVSESHGVIINVNCTRSAHVVPCENERYFSPCHLPELSTQQSTSARNTHAHTHETCYTFTTA